MSDRDVIAALQRQAAQAELERLRLVGEVEALVEALEEMVSEWPDMHASPTGRRGPECVLRAEAAIAKARGTQ